MLQGAQRLHQSQRAGHRARASHIRPLALWLAALVFAGVVAAAGLAFAQVLQPNARVEFDIPSQPLGAALNRYSDATGHEVLYDTSLAEGRASGAVQGLFTPSEALERLLVGTGLLARFVAENSFVLLRGPSTDRQLARRPPTSADLRYYGLIQQNLLEALCRSGSARPGRYRIAVVFWINPVGVVENLQRIGSVGTAEVDRQFDAALHSLKLSEPPPADFAQPVLILLVPQSSSVTPGCSKADDSVYPVRIAQ